MQKHSSSSWEKEPRRGERMNTTESEVLKNNKSFTRYPRRDISQRSRSTYTSKEAQDRWSMWETIWYCCNMKGRRADRQVQLQTQEKQKSFYGRRLDGIYQCYSQCAQMNPNKELRVAEAESMVLSCLSQSEKLCFYFLVSRLFYMRLEMKKFQLI